MKKFLAVRPSFFEGIARILDIFGILQDRCVESHHRSHHASNNHKPNKALVRVTPGKSLHQQALDGIDAKFLTSDWETIKHDMKVAARRTTSKSLGHISAAAARQTRATHQPGVRTQVRVRTHK